jgi:hypothetical protein
MKLYQVRCGLCGHKTWVDWLMSWMTHPCTIPGCTGTMTLTGRERDEEEDTE